MPNWVTNKVQAPPHIIRAMLGDDGSVDFNNAAPFEGPNDLGDICCEAEHAAEIALKIEEDTHPAIALLRAENAKQINLRTMREESFRQFVSMLENFRACGYLHRMDFARAVWGTKWNACESTADPDNGVCQFETAWSCPMGVFRKISERFPDDTITVTYADEDIGRNCGTFSIKGGDIFNEEIAPDTLRSDADNKKWADFACKVNGIDPNELYEE